MAERKVVCEIITPERIVFSGVVDAVTLPGVEGEIGVLALHAPLVTALKIGEVRIVIDNEKQYAATSHGFAEISEDKVSVLVESAEMAGEIDIERANRAKEKAEQELNKLNRQEGLEFSLAQADVEKALNRLRVAGRL